MGLFSDFHFPSGGRETGDGSFSELEICNGKRAPSPIFSSACRETGDGSFSDFHFLSGKRLILRVSFAVLKTEIEWPRRVLP